MEKLRDATLLFLIKSSEGKITDICLAMKKIGFGIGRWNGTGGKVEQGESIESAVIREAMEELGITAADPRKIAELSFHFPHNPAWDQKVHVYFSEDWEGEPVETEEMRPKWFNVSEIPFKEMWPDDIFWVPKVISGKLVQGMFRFGEGDVVLEKEVNVVSGFA